jgi:tol-pal system protein YbgF
MFRRFCVWILIASPASLLAADKSVLELQRDVASLQDQVRQLQQSQDKSMAAIQVLVQQALSASQDSGKSVAVIQSGLQQSLRDLEGKVVNPVAGLSTRMDQVSGDVRNLAQAVSDLTSTLGRMQSQLTDLNNAVKVLSAPAPPPPPQGGSGGGPAPTAEVPPINSTDLYQNALRDKNGGKFDLALQEFTDYLKWFGNTELAPNAQYYIGWIHYSQKAYDVAANDFDMVLEKYPDNNKTADAKYYKGMSLVYSGHKTQAIPEFNDLIKTHPGTDTATKACSELKDLGMHCPVVAPVGSKTSSAKRKGD